MTPDPSDSRLRCLSVIIPARAEQACIASTVEHLNLELRLHNVPHEIIVVDEGGSDRTWEILPALKTRGPVVVPIENHGQDGFGRDVRYGVDHMTGDATAI